MPPRKTSRWGRPLPPSVLSLWYRMAPARSGLRPTKATFVGLLLAAIISTWYFASGRGWLSSGSRHRHITIHDLGELTPDLDYSGDYMVVGPLRGSSGHSPGDQGSGGRRIVLATHCSPSNVHELYSLLLDAWHGPASVAVFVDSVGGGLASPSAAASDSASPSAVERLLDVLHALVACRDDTWVYVVYPVAADIRAVEHAASAAGRRVSCGDLLADLQAVSRLHAGRNYDRDGVVSGGGGSSPASAGSPYPGNMLRNVALRRARRDDYALVVDVDMTPSADLHERLAGFLFGAKGSDRRDADGERRVAYVLPCFESKHGKGVSFDRPTLERLWRLGLVRPFYAEACPQCQATTDYERWMGLGGGDAEELSHAGAVRLAYEAVRQRSDAWEPFFVARKWQLPTYDERFKQYGYNRISQICEMHMLGFQFFVLDNAFLVHKGFKTELSFHASKKAELENNTKLYRQFRWEMKDRYQNGREC